MSNFTTISCESCGAELSLPKGDTSITCGFCDTLNKPDLENLKPQNKTKVMMFNAVESDNWEEVGKYATQLLEDDPSDYESWFYKGASAGWVSRHIDDPSKEMMNCFRNAFANSSKEDTEEVIELFATKGVDLLDALARGSRGFAQEHGYLDVGDMLSNSWQADIMNGHISKIFGFLKCAHLLTEINRKDKVDKLNPAIDAYFLKLSSYLYTKIPFEGTFTNKNPFNLMDATFQFVYDPDSEIGLEIEPRIDEIIDTYKNGGYEQDLLDNYGLTESNFESPRAGTEDPEAGGGGCFVATAVYGTEDHFDLIVLRSFRDNFLSNYYLGKKFIASYYKYGPNFARKVSKSSFLKGVFSPLVNLGVIIVRYFKIG